MKKTMCLFLFIFMLVLGVDAGNRIAITAGEVVTVSGGVIEDGTILISGETIENVGKNLDIPSGYRIYAYPNGTVYPGVINLLTRLGLSGVSMVKVWSDYRETGRYKPEISAFTAFYPWGNLIPITRDFGTLTVLSAPDGGYVSGAAVLVNLTGWSPEDMFVKKRAAMIMNIPTSGENRDKQPSNEATLSKEKKELKAFVSKSYRYYLQISEGVEKQYHARFDAMRDIWGASLPVIASARTESDIKFAIQLGKEFGLNLILFNAYEGESVLQEIKKSGYPVIVASMYNRNQKWEHGYDKVYRLPAALHRAGIKFAFSNQSAANAFDLPIQAARAVAYGLPQDEALKALTVYPAEMMGLTSYGSIEPGKVANLVVTDGDLLDTSTRVTQVFIKGNRVKGKNYFIKEYIRARDKISGEY